MVDVTGEHSRYLVTAETYGFLIVVAVIKRLLTVGEIFLTPCAKLCHQLPEIRLRILRILVKNLFTIGIRFSPVAVFKEHERTFQKRRCARTGRINNNGLLR